MLCYNSSSDILYFVLLYRYQYLQSEMKLFQNIEVSLFSDNLFIPSDGDTNESFILRLLVVYPGISKLKIVKQEDHISVIVITAQL